MNRLGRKSAAAVLMVVALAAASCQAPVAEPPPQPPVPIEDFAVSTVIGGLWTPTNLEIAPDGRVFVAEKAGQIRTLTNMSDPSLSLTADLGPNVVTFNDFGLLGLAVDPGYPAKPYLYAFYAYDPTGRYKNICPDPPGAFTGGCPVSARITRFTVDPTTGAKNGAEQTLVDRRWCFQFPSHTADDLAFLPDGSLLASAGDGADFLSADIGALPLTGGITPRNPCGDPPTGVGGNQTAPTAEGGALRSQDILTPGDPTGFGGSLIRINPNTGAPVSGSPLIGRGAADDDAVVAHGLRNPFRIRVRPGTSEVWVSDVGWKTHEEINRITSTTDTVVENFGWPCREGPVDQDAYSQLGLNLCAAARNPGAISKPTDPYLSYTHGSPPDSTRCRGGEGGSVSGLDFLRTPTTYPTRLAGALVFSDYAIGCVWAMRLGVNGQPDPNSIETLARGEHSVDLEVSADGTIYLLDIVRNEIRRIDSRTGSPPVASMSASTDNGPLPLRVNFDASASTDPGGAGALAALDYTWDLDGNGTYGDATGPTASRTYTQKADVVVAVKVTDPEGLVSIATTTVHAGRSRPQLNVTTGPAGWAVGTQIPFSALATDAEDGSIPGSAIKWEVDLHHCATPTDCHIHIFQVSSGASGSVAGPDHDMPSFITIKATVTDSSGLSTTKEVRLDPRTVDVVFDSAPRGLQLTVGATVVTTPATIKFIPGSTRTVSAPLTQSSAGATVTFDRWSDGGTRTRNITFNAARTVRAEYSVH